MTGADEKRLADYLERLRAQVNDEAIELGDGDVASAGFREDVFTRVILGFLEDRGHLADTEVCYLDQRVGRGIVRTNAWAVDLDSAQVTLVTTLFNDLGEPARINRADLLQAVQRAVRALTAAGRGLHEGMEPASDVYAMMHRLHEVRREVDRLRVVVLVDGLAADASEIDPGATELEVQVDVWDLLRLSRADASGLPYEPIEIDLIERLGEPLPCVASPDEAADYEAYLAILPGNLLHDLYHEHGSRLLELNVRSFLQARGKVNRGIRDTLGAEPSYFMAYNNGISATAEGVETVHGPEGLGLARLRGLQIVNGGQTVASIHRARDRHKADLSSVFVQAKLTVVRPDQVETLVPKISRFANTQNRVNEADFSANHPFHVTLQRLSETIWTPGEQSRWFYERARGQYEVAQQREGTTPARLRKFKQAHPPRQRLDKVKLAKYVNAWDQLPHVVSQGGQKNFVAFMERLGKARGHDWEPDAAYFREVIARAIIFKHAEHVARKLGLPAYRANAVAYTVALVSYRTAGRVAMTAVWNAQAVPEPLADTLGAWMPQVYDAFIASAEGRNVTEWCKKEACWRRLQNLDLVVPSALEKELAAGQPLPTVGAAASGSHQLTAGDRENIARVMQVPPEAWVHISGWGARTGKLEEWQCGIATTLASYAAGEWQRVPSHKQAKHGVRILQTAGAEGGLPESDAA